jgi:hypothetical protein
MDAVRTRKAELAQGNSMNPQPHGVEWNEGGLTVFVTSSGKSWQIVSRFGVKGEYDTRKKAVGEALRIASRHGARQVLAQSSVGKYKRVWPKFSAVRTELSSMVEVR